MAMTVPAITVAPYESVAEAPQCERHGVSRLPVVKDEKLIGIVTRADLVRAFIRSDEEIARRSRTRCSDERSGSTRGRSRSR